MQVPTYKATYKAAPQIIRSVTSFMSRRQRVPKPQFIQQPATPLSAPRTKRTKRPTPKPRTTIHPTLEFKDRPTPAPRKLVKQIVYEDS